MNNIHYYIPDVDVYETENAFVVLADIPGTSRENLDVKIEDDVLYVDAKSSLEYNGIQIGYKKTFDVTRGLDIDKLTANLKDGVLRLDLPKNENMRAKRIDVM